MERISIFNYEAFYLDFLEGNLNEADTLLLMNFLEANPDLQVDMEDGLSSFQEESIELDHFSKLLLKADTRATAITSENVDYFIVAQSEGVLDEVKEKELSAIIAGNETLEKERKLAGMVMFSPNTNIIYSDKAGLKKKSRVLVLWPYAAAIAAASVVLFFWSTIDSTPISVEPIGSKISASTNYGVKNEKVTSDSKLNKSNQNEKTGQNQSINQAVKKNQFNSIENVATKESSINQMKSNPIGPIALINEQKLAPIGTIYSTPKSPMNEDKNEVEDLALVIKTEMHNPIEPLTKFVSKKTNTEVDFQTTKKVDEGRRGFHLKIGQFEISKKKKN